jgi:hypothetical protein
MILYDLLPRIPRLFISILKNMPKSLLLASFVPLNNTDSFYTNLEQSFNIPKNKIFVFKNLDDPAKLILTFKLVLADGERIDFKTYFKNTIIIHKQGTALYTINALNKLIESEMLADTGNIDYSTYKIDWKKYQNNIILTDKEKLVIYNIEQIFS